MRKTLFWLGWVVLLVLPVVYGVQIFLSQDFPDVRPWQWAIPIVAAALVYLSRNRDDVLKHHLV